VTRVLQRDGPRRSGPRDTPVGRMLHTHTHTHTHSELESINSPAVLDSAFITAV